MCLNYVLLMYMSLCCKYGIDSERQILWEVILNMLGETDRSRQSKRDKYRGEIKESE